jgi:hypothetical protein
MKKPKLKKERKAAYWNDGTLLLASHDKCMVNVLSTCSTWKLESVRRRVKGSGEKEVVEKPSVIVNCTKNMGGVDTA